MIASGSGPPRRPLSRPARQLVALLARGLEARPAPRNVASDAGRKLAHGPATTLLEVVTLVEVRDQPRLGGLPPEQLARESAGGRAVESKEACEPREVLTRIIGRD